MRDVPFMDILIHHYSFEGKKNFAAIARFRLD